MFDMFFYGFCKVKIRCVWIILAFSYVVGKNMLQIFLFYFLFAAIPSISKCPFVSRILIVTYAPPNCPY
jgi:hypothetical protein